MSPSRNIPIRFNEEMIRELEEAANRMGLANRSDLIKFCVKTFLRHFAEHGSESLPPNWREILKDIDGRTHRYAAHKAALKAVEDKPDYGQRDAKKRRST